MLGNDMILKKFEYNHWANGRVLEHANKATLEQWDAPQDYSRGSLHHTLFHILRVEQGWLYMCEHGQRSENLPAIESFPTASSLQPYAEQVHTTTMTYLNSLDESGLRGTITPIGPDGNEHTLIIWHILTHVLYHSAQHRSEVAALLTEYGQSPGDLDFIYFID